MKVNQKGKGRDDYQTPKYIFEQLNDIFNFTTDASCTSENKLCPQGFCIDQGFDGLKVSWSYHRIFCNPPFSNKELWLEKAHKEVTEGKCPVCIMILPLNAMSTQAVHKYIMNSYHYEILEQRISFIKPDDGQPDPNNNIGTAIIFFMKKPKVIRNAA